MKLFFDIWILVNGLYMKMFILNRRQFIAVKVVVHVVHWHFA